MKYYVLQRMNGNYDGEPDEFTIKPSELPDPTNFENIESYIFDKYIDGLFGVKWCCSCKNDDGFYTIRYHSLYEDAYYNYICIPENLYNAYIKLYNEIL